MAFKVKFWGVRGSIACPSPRHIKFGGNTSCVEVFAGDHRFILDAGTGIRSLGHEFIRDGIQHIDLLLTHTHWDHINGFPFFVPAYSPKWSLHIRAGHLKGKDRIRDVLSSQMDNPMFPVPLEAMQAQMVMEDFTAGESFDLNEYVHVRTAPLNHPNGATAYRIEYGGHAICYVTDTEHVDGELDQKILDLIDGADVMIYDATYTEDEMPMRKGVGAFDLERGRQTVPCGRDKAVGAVPPRAGPRRRFHGQAGSRGPGRVAGHASRTREFGNRRHRRLRPLLRAA